MLIARRLVVCFVLLVMPISDVVGDPRDRNEVADRSPVAFDKERVQKSRMGRSMMRSLETAAQGRVQEAAVQTVESALDFWLPSLGEDAPEWTKRIEFEWDIQEDFKPEFSILTVQPLFQTEDKRHTVFTQFRGALNRQFGDPG